MTQTVVAAIPIGDVIIVEAQSIRCQKCDQILGAISRRQGRTLLMMGGALLIMAEGECNHCDEPFRWTASKRALDRLLRHYPKS